MGRGRAKAKQTRVARDLKYRPVDTDFESLERELRGGSDEDGGDTLAAVPDPYTDLVQGYEDPYVPGAAEEADEGHDIRR